MQIIKEYNMRDFIPKALPNQKWFCLLTLIDENITSPNKYYSFIYDASLKGIYSTYISLTRLQQLKWLKTSNMQEEAFQGCVKSIFEIDGGSNQARKIYGLLKSNM